MTRRLVVEGQDGSAKTPFITEMARQLRAQGHQVATCAPFKVVEAVYGTDPYHLWSSCPKELMLMFRAVMMAPEANIVLFDRGHLTVRRGLDRTTLSEGFCDDLVDELPAYPMMFIDADMEVILDSKRLKEQGMPPWDLHKDHARRLVLADRANLIHRIKINSRRENLEALAAECIKVVFP